MSCHKNNKSDGSILLSIDKAKLKQGDMNAVALFGFAANPHVFEERLEELGLEFSKNPLDDIYYLSIAHRKGADRDGSIKDGNGDAVRFNFMEFVKSIPIDNSSRNPIEIEWS